MANKKLTFREKIVTGIRKSSAIILFLAIWQILPSIGVVNKLFIPPITDILSVLVSLAKSGELAAHTEASLARAVGGFALAAVIGIPLGFLLGGWFKKFEEFLDPLLQLLAQINPFSLFPVFILFFGIGEQAKIAIIFWVSIWPVLFNTILGVKTIDPLLIKGARAMATPKFSLFYKVVLPGAAPLIFAGIKQSIGTAFLMLIAAEMIGANKGLGWLILNAQVNYNINKLFAAAITIALLGIILTKIVSIIEKRVITWKEESPSI